jgi:hypothetical protein
VDKINRLVVILKTLMGKAFYGKIEISLEAGTIVNLKVTENIKI